MDNTNFVNKLKNVVEKYKTVYMWGCFGQLVTNNIIEAKAKQYPSWYNKDRIAKFKNLVGKNYFGFDCVCLIKGILWGWNGSKTKAHGGAEYQSNGVPDIDADAMFEKCKNKSTNFNKIELGEAVWLPGHIGIYIGDNKVIECTPIWKDGVQITELKKRDWKKHGKLPYVEYKDTTITTTNKKEETNNIYVVKAGDTLTKIANEYGTTIKAIADANNIENVNLIITGQKLIIPNKKVANKTKKVTANNGLILRKEPKKNSTYLGAYSKGTKVTVTEENVTTADGYKWDAVIVNGKKGYMANEFLG